MADLLTRGALATIMQGGDYTEPVVQVLRIKKMNTGSGQPENDRYRAYLSDGQYVSLAAMMTAQVYAQAGEKGLPRYTIMKIKRFMTSFVKNTKGKDSRVLFILDMQLLRDGDEVGEKFGSPIPYTEDAGTSHSNGTSADSSLMRNRSVDDGVVPSPKMSRTEGTSNADSSNANITLSGHIMHPMASLWKSLKKAKMADLLTRGALATIMQGGDYTEPVVQVLRIKKLNTGRGQPENDRYRAYLSDGQYVSLAAMMTAQVYAQAGEKGLPRYTIMKIKRFMASFVKNTKGKDSRVLLILDMQVLRDGDEVGEKFGSPIPYTEDAGTSHSSRASGDSSLTRNRSVDDGVVPSSKMSRTESTSNAGSSNANITLSGHIMHPMASLSPYHNKWMNKSEKDFYYQVKGTILLLQKENCLYKACEECNKKVVDLHDGTYLCEKCKKCSSSFRYRFLCNMNVGEWGGNQWVSTFNDEAEKIVGMSAQEAGQLMETDQKAFNNMMERMHFKEFIFKCRAKMETYNDEHRLKTLAVRVDSINYEEYNAYLISSIKRLTNFLQGETGYINYEEYNAHLISNIKRLANL